MPLRKAATFHSPKSPPSEEIDPIINVPSLPKRSRTCPKTLEDVIAAGEKRMADLIGSFDRSLSGLEALSTDSQDTLRGEDLPVPRVVLDAHVPDIDMMDVDPKSTTGRSDRRYQPQQVRNHHTSDSGIGSTVSGTIHSNTNISTSINQGMHPTLLIVSSTCADDHAAEHKRGSRNRDAGDSGPSHELIPVPFNTKTTHSAITRSISSTASAGAANQHLLSEYATKQIQKHIITPILREKSLKNFHPFVHGLPRRIRQKEITCLRDLEKTLIFLAPVSRPLDLREGDLAHCYLRYLKNWSVSKTAYLKFCETSIQCIHTTVDYLSEGDQRRPSDRPYTNGYFLDLVEQIRQYAAMMAASRERQASGEEMDDNDYSP